MNITKVVVRPLTGSSGGRLLAFANLIVDDQYVVNGLRIYRNRNGELEVQYPSLHAPKQYKHLGYRTLYAVVPMNRTAHEHIKQTVLSAYKDMLQTSRERGIVHEKTINAAERIGRMDC